MKTLWAPWRMEYILSNKGPGCIFCDYPKEKNDRENLILYRGNEVYVIMNRYPYNNGHLMVIPYTHRPSLDGLSAETMCEMMSVAQYSVDCISRAFRPEGFNIGVNIGKVAGAGIDEHLHIHIVPRWAGDASFVTVIGELKVIPEHLLDTYDKLFPFFNREDKF